MKNRIVLSFQKSYSNLLVLSVAIFISWYHSSLSAQDNIMELVNLSGLKFSTIKTMDDNIKGYYSLYELEKRDYEYAYQIWDENLNSQGVKSFTSKDEMEIIDSEASGKYIGMLFKDRKDFEFRIHNYQKDSSLSIDLKLHDDLRKRKDYGNYITAVPDIGFIMHQYVDYNTHLYKYNGESELLFEGDKNDIDDFDIKLIDYDERYLYFALTRERRMIFLDQSDHLIRFAVYDMKRNKMVVESQNIDGYGSPCIIFDAYKEGEEFLFTFHDYEENEYSFHYFEEGDVEPEVVQILANYFIVNMDKKPKKLSKINVAYQMIKKSEGVYSFFAMPFDKNSFFSNSLVGQGIAYVELNSDKEVKSIKMLETFEEDPEFQYSQSQNDSESVVSVVRIEDKFHIVRYMDGLILKDEIPIKDEDTQYAAFPAKKDFMVILTYDEKAKDVDLKLHRLPELQR